MRISSVFSKLALVFIAMFFLAVTVQADEMGTVDTSKAHVAKIQKFIENLKSEDSTIEEINVHATGNDGETMRIASTTPGRAGTPSDPEDIDAIIENKVIVIPEGGSLDVTVPMANKAGMPAAVAGITIALKDGLDKAGATSKAVELAKKIDMILVTK